jgi:hypothetical protein
MRRGGRRPSRDATHTASGWLPCGESAGVLPLTGHRLAVTAAADPGLTYATRPPSGARVMVDAGAFSPGTTTRTSWPVAGSNRHSSRLALKAPG